jgi:hypothetical protein
VTGRLLVPAGNAAGRRGLGLTDDEQR